jgi:predicted flap endonuclease-1-like 5' DNA nuclease/uncharacterized protein (UPF0335 family)
MPLSDDVRQLSRNLLQAYDSRLMAVRGIRSQTAQELAEFKAARRSLAAEQHRRLGNHRQRLADQVARLRREASDWLGDTHATQQSVARQQRRWLDEQTTQLRQETGAFLGEMASEHQSMSIEQRQRLDEQHRQLVEEVNRLRHEAGDFLKELQIANQSVAAEQRHHLDEHVGRLRCETGTLMGDLRAARQVMAAGQRRQLDEHIGRLRRETGMLMGNLHTVRRAMAKGQRKWLGDQMQNLATERMGMAAAVGDLRNKLQKDRAEARRAWSSFGKLKQQRQARSGQSVTASPSAARLATPFQAEQAVAASPATGPAPLSPVPGLAGLAEAPAAYSRPADDLTAIHGIGQAMRNRLNKGGIHTYSQLGAQTPEALRDLLGDMGRLANVENWILEAQRLAGRASDE